MFTPGPWIYFTSGKTCTSLRYELSLKLKVKPLCMCSCVFSWPRCVLRSIVKSSRTWRLTTRSSKGAPWDRRCSLTMTKGASRTSSQRPSPTTTSWWCSCQPMVSITMSCSGAASNAVNSLLMLMQKFEKKKFFKLTLETCLLIVQRRYPVTSTGDPAYCIKLKTSSSDFKFCVYT